MQVNKAGKNRQADIAWKYSNNEIIYNFDIQINIDMMVRCITDEKIYNQ